MRHAGRKHRKAAPLLILGVLSIAAWQWWRRQGWRRQWWRRKRGSSRAHGAGSSDRRTRHVAHELNNYLGAIRGYCEVAKLKNPDDPALAKYMDAAMEGTVEAATLIRELGRDGDS